MKMELPEFILKRFNHDGRKLTIAANRIAGYLSLPLLDGNALALDFKGCRMGEVEIDEGELDDPVLKDKDVFALVVLYAVLVGE